MKLDLVRVPNGYAFADADSARAGEKHKLGQRVRATVGQRNRRDRSREFQPALMEENGAKVVRVWLLRDDKNSTPEAAPEPEAPAAAKPGPAATKPGPATAKG